MHGLGGGRGASNRITRSRISEWVVAIVVRRYVEAVVSCFRVSITVPVNFDKPSKWTVLGKQYAVTRERS